MTAPTPSVISGDCCIPYSNLKVEEYLPAIFKIHVDDEFAKQVDLTYHINFGDGTTIRNQTLKWERKYGYYIEIPHKYSKKGLKNAYLFVENKTTLRKAKCAKIIVEVSPMRSVTPTPTKTPSITPTPSITSTVSKTPTVTPSISVTSTPSQTITPSVTTTTTPSATQTRTPSASITSTATPSVSTTQTQTPTPTRSVTQTPTPTTSVTQTPTPTTSVTQTPTPSISVTQTPTPSISVTQTPTPSISVTQTPSATTSTTPGASASPTPSVTSTVSVTLSSTPTPTPTCLTKKLCVRFQYPSTYVVEGQTTGVRVYRESCACEDYLLYTGAFTIDYRAESQPLSAQEGLDFHSNQTGTLHFGVGENMKIIPITTIDDDICEGSEFFNVFLENIENLPCVEEKILYKNPYQVLITDDDPCDDTPPIQKFELCDTDDLVAGTGNQQFQMIPHDSPNVWGTGYISTGLAYTGGLLTEAQTGSFRV